MVWSFVVLSNVWGLGQRATLGAVAVGFFKFSNFQIWTKYDLLSSFAFWTHQSGFGNTVNEYMRIITCKQV